MSTPRSCVAHRSAHGRYFESFIDVQFERDDQPVRDVPTAIFVAFRGVGVVAAERLAAADRRGAVLYGRPLTRQETP